MPERNRRQYRKWARARFFYDLDDPGEHDLNALTTDIEARIAGDSPDIEVLLVEVVEGDTLRVFIDHPNGVTLVECTRVTELLNEYREQYAIEVSSPGEDRPLTKPQHFRRFLGQRAKLRLREARDGHKSVTGELVGASDEEVTIAAGEGIVSIPYEQIARSNLVPGD
ncbi:MAG TPA: ribosome maturation factor RimP [Solirubrobacteraceae bacterium]|nr:ribosome maturation factor RimP [Solirubrobacteraceae bacterium]